jgi:hypothetical protein
MDIWFAISTFIFAIGLTQIIYRWLHPKEKAEAIPDKPNFPPPIPPPPPPIPKVYGTTIPNYNINNYIISTVKELTRDEMEKMQKELENHLFSNLARPHHKIPILEPFGLPKRKEENHEPIKEPKRKITY